jgi:hypothetical protein
MKPSETIKYKALFLLVTFSLNSIVGFACSVGVYMGFNSGHYCHDRDKQREHTGTNSYGHHHGVASQQHAANHSSTISFTSQPEDNCCKDFVVGFHSMDKLLAKQNSGQQKISDCAPSINILIAELNNIKELRPHLHNLPKEVNYLPPDIRILIQSFQI